MCREGVASKPFGGRDVIRLRLDSNGVVVEEMLRYGLRVEQERT